jgi:hypothetical protein
LYVLPEIIEENTLNGYFPRIKALNRNIDKANEQLDIIVRDLTPLSVELETAKLGLSAAESDIE